MNDRPKKLLEQSLADLRHARIHLDYSYAQVCQWENTLEQLKEDELESVEAFTSRFARCVDLLVNKVLRSLDRYELKPGGTLLDGSCHDRRVGPSDCFEASCSEKRASTPNIERL